MDHILHKVREYYSRRIVRHGPTPRGVDWSSEHSQRTRFDQLLRVTDGESASFSINDYGCGYAALVDYLAASKGEFRYCGYDVSEEMVTQAREIHGHRNDCRLTTDLEDLETEDYCVASGVLNVKLDVAEDQWTTHVLTTIDHLARLSRRGFAFNALTTYSDPERMQSYLYYADPCFLFDLCKRRYSRWVALFHDYGLYEFTIVVRRDGEKRWQS